MSATVSPNGRWILYTSDDGSGVPEGFVARFPGGGGRRPIPTDGAELVRWTRDGKEVLVKSRSKLVSIPVRETGDALDIGEPRTLVEMRIDCMKVFGSCFDVSPDGKRFLIMDPVGSAQPVTLVQNWQAGLNR